MQCGGILFLSMCEWRVNDSEGVSRVDIINRESREYLKLANRSRSANKMFTRESTVLNIRCWIKYEKSIILVGEIFIWMIVNACEWIICMSTFVTKVTELLVNCLKERSSVTPNLLYLWPYSETCLDSRHTPRLQRILINPAAKSVALYRHWLLHKTNKIIKRCKLYAVYRRIYVYYALWGRTLI